MSPHQFRMLLLLAGTYLAAQVVVWLGFGLYLMLMGKT